MLFHYHYWTPHVEETERFYRSHGFEVTQRIGKANGEFQSFNLPMEWDDFREKNIIFRIIEMRKGNVNITFGYGKKVMFDHIGYFVSDEKCEQICMTATDLGWKVNKGDRRTFIETPYGFKIELQTHADVLNGDAEKGELECLLLSVTKDGLLEDLTTLFEESIETLSPIYGDEVKILEAHLHGFEASKVEDPNGVLVVNKSNLD